MTPDRDDVKVVQSMIDTMVGIPKFSYPSHTNNAPRPTGEFAHVKLIEAYPVGIPSRNVLSQTAETTDYVSYVPNKLRFRIGVVDSDGIASSKILNGWTSEAMKNIMMSTGYGFIRVDPISNEDAKLEKEWEYRKGFSLELYATRKLQETVDNITGVTIGMKYYEDDQAVYISTIEVND